MKDRKPAVSLDTLKNARKSPMQKQAEAVAVVTGDVVAAEPKPAPKKRTDG